MSNIGTRYSDDVLHYTIKQGKYTPVEITSLNWEKYDNIAESMYSSFRSSSDDIQAIVKNTGWEIKDINQIKNHIFNNELRLDDGIRQLDPDYEMAIAWDRLTKGEFYNNDILLLKHELYESSLYKMNDIAGITQREAHNLANEVFNWQDLIESLK